MWAAAASKPPAPSPTSAPGRPLLVGQMRRLGVDSVPIALFIAVFTGIVLSLLSSYIFTGAVPLYFVGALVGKTIMMELGPVLTGMALAGRVGASIAAELGHHEGDRAGGRAGDAGLRPLLLPGRAAGARGHADVSGGHRVRDGGRRRLRAGSPPINLLDLSTPEFLKGLKQFYRFKDIWFGLVKSASFGAAVALMGCLRGLDAKAGAAGRRASPPPAPWCSAARRSWCWTRSGRWCCCEAAADRRRRVIDPARRSLDQVLRRQARPRRACRLEVPDGQNTVIIGYSGSGKSVTLKCIVGLLEPDGGRVVVDGDDGAARWTATSWRSCAAGSATSSSSRRCSTR